MGEKISDYPAITTLAPQDLLDVSEWNGATFDTKKITVANMAASLSVLVDTLYTADGTLTGDRSVNLGGYNLRFANGKSTFLEPIWGGDFFELCTSGGLSWARATDNRELHFESGQVLVDNISFPLGLTTGNISARGTGTNSAFLAQGRGKAGAYLCMDFYDSDNARIGKILDDGRVLMGLTTVNNSPTFSAVKSSASIYGDKSIFIGDTLAMEATNTWRLMLGYDLNDRSGGGVFVGNDIDTAGGGAYYGIQLSGEDDADNKSSVFGIKNTFGWCDIVFGSNNTLEKDNASTNGRMAFGDNITISKSDKALAIGYYAKVGAADNLSDSAAIGNYTQIEAAQSMMIGIGVNSGSKITHNRSNTIGIGCYSTVPTVYVTGGTGNVGSIGNLGVATVDFGSGRGCIGIANAASVPSADPTGGGVLYVEGGALKYRGSSGTVTIIANA